MKRLRLFFLRHILRARYIHYYGLREEQFSCGNVLAHHISLRLWRARDNVNATIRKIRKLDPKCKIAEL